jgi:CMP-N-acetylneuraminic acid synthetase
MNQNIVFLPCRKGSQRVPNKNTRPFAGVDGGLLRIKLEELLKAKLIDKIILSSNDAEVLQIGKEFNHPKLCVMERPENLCTSATSTDELIAYVAELIPQGTILWTHVTSPFLSAETYDKMLQIYHDNRAEYDSLMSVNVIRNFLWNDSHPINYNRSIEKWPRTQTLQKIFEPNSGAFIADASVYHTMKDRIGERVYMYETSKLESLDIDWPEDFEFAEQIYLNLHAQ